MSDTRSDAPPTTLEAAAAAFRAARAAIQVADDRVRRLRDEFIEAERAAEVAYKACSDARNELVTAACGEGVA